MPSPIKPSDICALVPSGTSNICDRINAVFIKLPKAVCDWISWMFTSTGEVSDTFRAESQLSNFFCVAAGVDVYTATNTDAQLLVSASTWLAGTSYGNGNTTSLMLPVKFTNANTGSATFNLNGAGAKPIKKFGVEDLEAGDIVSGGIYLLSFDGVNWQLLSQSPFVFKGLTGTSRASFSLTASTKWVRAQHHLGVVPTMMIWRLVNVNTDAGYSPGDELDPAGVMVSHGNTTYDNESPAFAPFCDNVYFGVAMGFGGNPGSFAGSAYLSVVNKTTGNAATFTPANWIIAGNAYTISPTTPITPTDLQTGA